MSDQSESPSSVGDEVMKAVGNLDEATTNLSAQNEKSSADENEAVSILTIIGRVILNLFGK